MSASTFVVVPAPDLVVRDPVTKEPLPAEGATKPRSRYWLRRVAEGSCTVAPTSAPTKKSKGAKSAPTEES